MLLSTFVINIERSHSASFVVAKTNDSNKTGNFERSTGKATLAMKGYCELLKSWPAGIAVVNPL